VGTVQFWVLGIPAETHSVSGPALGCKIALFGLRCCCCAVYEYFSACSAVQRMSLLQLIPPVRCVLHRCCTRALLTFETFRAHRVAICTARWSKPWTTIRTADGRPPSHSCRRADCLSAAQQ